MDSRNLALLQFSPVWEDPASSHAVVAQWVQQADLPPGTLLVLPETFATGFSGRSDIAQHRDGPTVDFLRNLASRHALDVIAGVVLRDDDGLARNKALLIDSSGDVLAEYAKRRPFVPGGEPWEAGDAPCVVDWRGVPVALHICFDLRFPELFRDTLTPDAPLLHVVIASWPRVRIHHWTYLLRARAIENQAVVVGVNRTGDDPFHSHCGGSVVFDPDGSALLTAGSAEGIHRCVWSPDLVIAWRERLRFLP